MTTKLIEIEGTATITGTHEDPALKPLHLSEGSRSYVIDFGNFSLVLDSDPTGGGEVKNRLFVLNEENPSLVPQEHGIFCPLVNEIVFEKSG